MTQKYEAKQTQLAREAILCFQRLLSKWNITPFVHFELEGTCSPSTTTKLEIDYDQINNQLKRLGILGKVKDEYWQHQWEYVSLFEGQSPLEEAEYLSKAISLLPSLFKHIGFKETHIRPVIWSGDNKRLLSGGKNVFSAETKSMHIPNAIQLNISAQDAEGTNLIPQNGFGEVLQQSFLKTSYHCCLLFLPEEEAFQRLQLKSDYALSNELSSPSDISGGHQGSIALYKKLGKHNQPMGEKPLLLDQFQNTLASQQNWQKTSRVEHRLGASSKHYNPFVNVAYGLANLCYAISMHYNFDVYAEIPYTKQNESTQLPLSLRDCNSSLGAISLFSEETWFPNVIDTTINYLGLQNKGLGNKLKQAILKSYQPEQHIIV